MADFGFANKSNSSDFSSTGDKVNEVFGDLLLNRAELEAMITSLKRRQYGATPPANPNTGDIWECSTTGGGYTANVVYRYSGSAWAELVASAINVTNRNTVLQGKVTAGGLPDLFEAGTGLAVKLNATETPAIFAFMNGNSTSLGTVDIVAAVSADAATFWSSLPTSSTVYLYVDYTTGTVSGGFTTLAPVYQNIAPTHSAGLHWFDFNTGKVWSSDGSAWTQRNRIFVGTATTDGSGVTAVSVYAYNQTQGVSIFDDIITKGPWVDVRAFGAKGDGVTDDTAAIQAALNSVGSPTYVDWLATRSRGGVVFVPCGVYKITYPIFIPPNVALEGIGNVLYSRSSDITQLAGSVIFADFDNLEQSAVNAVGWKISDGTRFVGYYASGDLFDDGTYTLCDNVKIKNLSIVTNKNIAVGLCGVGSTTIKINNVSIIGFRNGGIVSSAWGGAATNLNVLASHSGFSPVVSCNGFSMRDCTLGKYPTLAYDASNKIITYLDYLDNTPFDTTGTYSSYSNAITFDNVIVEHFDRAYRCKNNDAMVITSAYIEDIANNCFDFTQCTFSIRDFWTYCDVATTNIFRSSGVNIGEIVGQSQINNGDTFNTFATGNGDVGSNITVNNCIIPADQQRVDGVNMFTNTDYYVNTATGNDLNSGTQTYPLQTITKALTLAVDKTNIYLSVDQTHHVDKNPLNYNISFHSYGTGAKPIIYVDSPASYSYGLYVKDGTHVDYNGIEYVVPSITVADEGARSGMQVLGTASVCFKDCDIKIGANVALFQGVYGTAGILNVTYANTTIDGHSATYGAMALPVYASGGKLVITDAAVASTINATIKAAGYSGATVIHSDILA